MNPYSNNFSTWLFISVNYDLTFNKETMELSQFLDVDQ
jgi:hypothetical protein